MINFQNEYLAFIFYAFVQDCPVGTGYLEVWNQDHRAHVHALPQLRHQLNRVHTLGLWQEMAPTNLLTYAEHIPARDRQLALQDAERDMDGVAAP